MLYSDFASVDLIDQDAWKPFWAATPQHAADYTFTNLWGWHAHYGMEWCVQDNLCWIRQTMMPNSDDLIDIRWAPLGDWEHADWESMQQIKPGLVLHRVPERLCTILQQRLPGHVIIEETRGQWEYLYNQSDLATLPGNKFHKKKNHVNAYKKAYGEDYRELTPTDTPLILAMQHEWCAWRGCAKSASLAAESDVIWHVVQRWDAFPDLTGGGLFIDDKLVAFSLGERLDEKSMVVHFEKALPDYRGIYQAINFYFSAHAGAPYAILDREQDTDEEGLRKAKESYYPSGFLIKNRVRFI